MPDLTSLLAFGVVSLGMVLTPGPNMMYLVSRSICQGRAAGLFSLGGVALGFLLYLFCAAFGISALLLTVPVAYDALRIAGALYLLYLAWQALKPGGRSPFHVKELAANSKRKLFMMGFLTNVLNPKIAVLYLSLLPQFIDPQLGSILGQSIVLGCEQIVISLAVNTTLVLLAGSVAAFLKTRPAWMTAQRWLMGGVLVGLAARLAFEGGQRQA